MGYPSATRKLARGRPPPPGTPLGDRSSPLSRCLWSVELAQDIGVVKAHGQVRERGMKAIETTISSSPATVAVVLVVSGC